MKRWMIGLCLISVLVIAACKQDVAIPDSHNASNALDWVGVYRGTLPCADCQGIVTMVTLQNDNQYELRTTYLHEAGATSAEKGAFVWSEDGNKIILQGEEKRQFHVAENRLIHLDLQGNKIDGALAEHYVLTKVPDVSLVEHYWKLVELSGNAVKIAQQEPHIILKSEDHRVIGSGGCNRLMGQYVSDGADAVRFQGMASTEMACMQGMDTESEFLKMLDKVQHYRIQGDVLTLFEKPDAQPIARLEAVFLY